MYLSKLNAMPQITPHRMDKRWGQWRKGFRLQQIHPLVKQMFMPNRKNSVRDVYTHIDIRGRSNKYLAQPPNDVTTKRKNNKNLLTCSTFSYFHSKTRFTDLFYRILEQILNNVKILISRNYLIPILKRNTITH